MSHLRIKENNNGTVECHVKDKLGAPQSITGWTFQFLVQTAEGVVLFNKLSTTSGHMTVVSATDGDININVVPVDTNDKAGSYQWEFKGTDTIGNQYTLGIGELTVVATLI